MVNYRDIIHTIRQDHSLQHHGVLRIPVSYDVSPIRREGYSSVSDVRMNYLELRRYNCTYHVSYEVLRGISEPYSGGGMNIRGMPMDFVTDRLTTCINYSLERAQPVCEQHPIVLSRIEVYEQRESDLIVFDAEMWATQMGDVDHIGKEIFGRTIEELLHGRLDLSNAHRPEFIRDQERDSRERFRHEHLRISMPEIDYRTYGISPALFGNSVYGKPQYNEDAEEKAHELLKSMITKKQFEHYKLEGNVTIKGTYGRTYLVKKGDMIQVTQKKSDSTKTYRLCIEPDRKVRNKICPTDEVICKIKLIKASEKKLHEIGNKFQGGVI